MRGRRAAFSFAILAAILALAALLTYRWLFAGLPAVDDLAAYRPLPSVRIVDRHGRPLYVVLAAAGGRHTRLPLAQIPPSLQQATIATEDATFFTNPGVDLRGVARAFWINLRGGDVLAGGSTITQQVARTLLLAPEERQTRTVRRKFRESWLAWQLARRLQKEDILALYLNYTYYGGMAYGVEAAAQTFFGKSARDLDLAESALLAGLPQSPAAYNPLINPGAARGRQRVVLDLMVKAGAIDAAERDLALQEPLRFAGRPYPIEAPHFVMMVQNQLDTLLAPFAPAVLAASGGLTVRTTLDLDWQHHAERIVSHQLAALNRPADGGPGHNTQSAALVALDPGNGQILALVGSPDYFDPASSGAINMALAPRQPGSAIKPLVYAAAFDPSRPTPWTAATMILDVATTFHTHEGDPYTPVNFDRREHGPVLAREALASSLNVPAVKALQHAGPKAVLDLAQAAGIDTLGNPDRYDLSLALGGGEVPLLQLTAAYAAFANGGYAVSPLAILHVADSQGRTVYTAAPPARRPILDERAAWLIGDILADDVARAPAFGRHSALQLDRPAAAKTGTTNDYRDNWTVGYTPDLVTGVWVGNPDMTPMRDVTGLSGAGPIWHQFMRTVLAGRPEQPFTRPPGLVQVEICTLSGLLPTAACPYRRREWFIAGTEPAAADTFYQMVTVDTASGRLATESTLPAQQVQRLALALPPQAHSWARAQGLLLVEDLLPPQAVATAAAASEPPAADRFLQLVQPAANAVFRLAPDVPVGAQSLRLAATVPGTAESVTFWVDGARLATLDAPPWQAWWPLQPGDHRAWVEGVTPAGERLRSETISFQVLARE